MTSEAHLNADTSPGSPFVNADSTVAGSNASPHPSSSSPHDDARSGAHAPHKQPPGAPGSVGNLHPRSCITCRRRKVRCDKRNPCSNCQKAKIECIFPAPGRAPRKARKPPETELIARLRKLESVVQSLGGSADDITSNERSDSPQTAHSRSNSSLKSPAQAKHDAEVDWAVDHQRASFDKNFGRLVLEQGRSRYVNQSFWANLSNEVEDLKAIMHESPSEDEELSPSSTPQSFDHGFMFHSGGSTRGIHDLHPPPDQLMAVWRSYEENVEPLLKMVHLPTVRAQVEKIKDHPASASRGFEALLFAIYFSTITSMSAEECEHILGEQKPILTARFRHAVERALAAAHFLVTKEFVVVQASLLYLLALRRYEDSRVIWTLEGLVVRMSISMGLHRDPSNFGLPPIEVEMRRRLWWHICVLDVRLSEDLGSDPSVLEKSHDVRLPLNVNDNDLDPNATESPIERIGITEMTLCLIRFETINTHRRLAYNMIERRNGEEQATTIADEERWIEECHHALEEKHLQYCDMKMPLHWVICTVARLIMAKMWLQAYQPYQRLDGGASLPSETRDRLFITSLESMEYALLLETEIRTIQWSWLFKSYSQWHSMAFLLSELCIRTRGPTVQRAWRAVDNTIAAWSSTYGYTNRAHVWRPLHKLMAKARSARDGELLNNQPPWQRSPNDGTERAPSSISANGSTFENPLHGFRPGVSSPDPNGSSLPPRSGNLSSQFAHRSGTANSVTSSRVGQSNPIANNSNTSLPGNDANTESPSATFGPSPFFINQPDIQPDQWPDFGAGAMNTDLMLDILGDPMGGSGSNANFVSAGNYNSDSQTFSSLDSPRSMSSSQPQQGSGHSGPTHARTWPVLPDETSASTGPYLTNSPMTSSSATASGAGTPHIPTSKTFPRSNPAQNNMPANPSPLHQFGPNNFCPNPNTNTDTSSGLKFTPTSNAGQQNLFGGNDPMLTGDTSTMQGLDNEVGWDDWNEMMRGVEMEGIEGTGGNGQPGLMFGTGYAGGGAQGGYGAFGN